MKGPPRDTWWDRAYRTTRKTSKSSLFCSFCTLSLGILGNICIWQCILHGYCSLSLVCVTVSENAKRLLGLWMNKDVFEHKILGTDSRCRWYCSVNNPQSAAKVSLSIMRAGSLLLNLHYPPVNQKPNTYNQLEAAPALRFPLLLPCLTEYGVQYWLKVGATEPPKQT